MFNNTSKPLPLAKFNTAIGIVLMEGFLLTALIIKIAGAYFAKWSPWLLVIVCFVAAIAGMVISAKSNRPQISFLGYNLVVVSMGAVLSVVFKDAAPRAVIHAAVITAVIIIGMIIAGQMIPSFFLKLERVLTIALIGVIAVELIACFAGWIRFSFWDVLVAGLFALWVGYDWAKAQRGELTLDAAIDSCVALYLDAANLLIRIVAIIDDDDHHG